MAFSCGFEAPDKGSCNSMSIETDKLTPEPPKTGSQDLKRMVFP